jgi:glutamyl/glutaminyl-tRNA synthetase
LCSGIEIASLFENRISGPWKTRFAPAPTGWLHLGHAVNAVFVWGLARAFGGKIALRIEDHDRGRCRPEYELGLLDDLDWLGLAPDIAPVRQSERNALYETALRSLDAVYACTCSRRDIADAAGDAGASEIRYPGTCREKQIDLSAVPTGPS